MVDQNHEKLTDEVKATMDGLATAHQVQALSDRQTKLELDLHVISKTVESMDAKLDFLISMLLPALGDDAKKGEKLKIVQESCSSGLKNKKNDDDKEDGASQDKKTSDAAGQSTVMKIVATNSRSKQSTHVSPSGNTRIERQTLTHTLIKETTLVGQVVSNTDGQS